MTTNNKLKNLNKNRHLKSLNFLNKKNSLLKLILFNLSNIGYKRWAMWKYSMKNTKILLKIQLKISKPIYIKLSQTMLLNKIHQDKKIMRKNKINWKKVLVINRSKIKIKNHQLIKIKLLKRNNQKKIIKNKENNIENLQSIRFQVKNKKNKKNKITRSNNKNSIRTNSIPLFLDKNQLNQ